MFVPNPNNKYITAVFCSVYGDVATDRVNAHGGFDFVPFRRGERVVSQELKAQLKPIVVLLGL